MPDTETFPNTPTHAACTVALSKLVLAKDNPRAQTDPDDEIDTLATSIAEIGLLQPLIVREAKTKFHVIDGRRRLLALKALQAGGLIDPDYQVTVILVEPAHSEAGLVANVQRRAMSETEIFRAVAALTKKVKSPDRIARTLGVEPRTVRQYQALGRLPDAILEGLETGSVSFETARTLCQIRDRDRCETLSARVAEGSLARWELEELLSETRRRSDEYICQFVTEAAYLAAGGKIEEELFHDWAYWTTPEAISDAFSEAVAPLITALDATGIKSAIISFDRRPHHLTTSIWDLIDEAGYESDEASETFYNMAETLNQAILDAIAAHGDMANEDSRATIVQAVIAGYTHLISGVPEEMRSDLEASVSFGSRLGVDFYRPPQEAETDETVEDETGADEAVETATGTQGDSVSDAERPAYEDTSSVLDQRLQEIRTRIFAKDLIEHADVAVSLLILNLFEASQVGMARGSFLTVRSTPFGLYSRNEVIAEDQSWAAIRAGVVEMLTPPDGVSAFTHVLSLSDDQRQTCLTVLIADCVALVDVPGIHRFGSTEMALAQEVAAEIGADPSRHWTPDTETLRGYTKSALAAIGEEVSNPVDPSDKKSAMISHIEVATREAGWTPPSVRLAA